MRILSATTLMSSVIPLWDKSLSLSRLRNAGEESGFYGAVEGVDSASHPFRKYRWQNTPAHSAFRRASFASISQSRLVGALRWLVHFDKLSDRSNHKLSDRSLPLSKCVGFSDMSAIVADRTTYEGNLAIFASNSELNFCMIRFICLLLL